MTVERRALGRYAISNELLYYDTLKRIAKEYMTTEKLIRRAYGVSYCEALEMSYNDIQCAAADAIRGKRRPKAGKGGEK
jgi:hypothetical protein